MKTLKHLLSNLEINIEKLENIHTIQKLITWIKIEQNKYDDPGRAIKGEQEKDLRKAKTYQNYYDFLRSLVLRNQKFADMLAKDVYNKLNIYWRYS